MITDLEISGFKALKSAKLEGLKRVTLIGGRNNSGKTSVLEAFFMSLDWGNPELITRHLNWRGIDAYSTEPNSAWAPAFFDFDLSQRIQVKSRAAQGDRYQFSIQATEPSRNSSVIPGDQGGKDNIREPGTPALRLSYTKGSKTIYDAQLLVRHGVPPYQLVTKIIIDKAPRAHYMQSRVVRGASEDAGLFGQLDQEKRTEDIVESLRLIEPKLRGLSVIPVGPSPQLFADVEGMSRKIPVNLLGDGITRLLSLLLRIANIPSGYLLVDEIENGFHYSVMPKVWEVIYQACKLQRCQLFATTHSYECLTSFAESLDKIADENYSYVRMERQGKDNKCTSYDANSLRDATAGGWEVR